MYASNLDNGETFKVNLVSFPEPLAEEVWSLKELHDAQQKDPDIAPVVQWLNEVFAALVSTRTLYVWVNGVY